MGYHRFVAKLSRFSLQCMAKVYHFINAVVTGLWLGVMSNKSLDQADELYYNRSDKYLDDDYNLSGLFSWEKVAIEKYFSNAKNILLLAAGCGRETLALSKMGFNVDSFECNKSLIEFGNAFLQRNGIEDTIKYLPRNAVPDEVKKYDGIIMGWGAYSLIRGERSRLYFLTELYPYLHKETPLLVSFLLTERKTWQDKTIKSVSNIFRIFRNTYKIEHGDRLIPNFVHFFSEEEIRSELLKAKYRIIGYNKVDYGSIVAVIDK